MPKFIITAKGRCYYTHNVEIEAEDAIEAMQMYRDGDYDCETLDEATDDHTETDIEIDEDEVKPKPKKGK